MTRVHSGLDDEQEWALCRSEVENVSLTFPIKVNSTYDGVNYELPTVEELVSLLEQAVASLRLTLDVSDTKVQVKHWVRDVRP